VGFTIEERPLLVYRMKRCPREKHCSGGRWWERTAPGHGGKLP